MFILLWLIVIMAYTMILRGLSLEVFWDWFVSGPDAPFYGSVPGITFAQALGISLLVAFLTYDAFDKKTENGGRDAGTILLESFFKITLIYGVFWLGAILYHSFM